MSAPASAPAPARTVKKLFSRETSIAVPIQAAPAIVWALLTNAADFSRWNSTVISIEGEIRPGAQIRLISTLDPKRVFRLKIKTFEPERQLAWGDAMGTRVYSLSSSGDGRLAFSMREKIGGPLFPLFAGMIPSFDASFEQFAADLKREAERIQSLQG